MNERILELAEESGFIVEDEEIYANELFHEITKDMEKFAELIIQECIAQVKLELNNRQLLLSNPPQNAGVWDACNNIRRHFGVKYER